MGNIWYKQCHRTSWLGILIFLNVAKSFRKSPKKIIMAVAMVTVPTISVERLYLQADRKEKE